MENINRAILMGGHILTFVIAVSVGIFLYQTIIAAQDAILIASENYTRRAENVALDNNYQRIVYGSEIYGTMMAALEITDWTTIVQKDEYVPDLIQVNGNSAIDINSEKMNAILDDKSYYVELFNKIGTIDFNGKYILTYKFNTDGKVTAIYSSFEE